MSVPNLRPALVHEAERFHPPDGQLLGAFDAQLEILHGVDHGELVPGRDEHLQRHPRVFEGEGDIGIPMNTASEDINPFFKE